MADPLTIGQPLPDLRVQTSDGAATTVQAHLGAHHTLLYFLHGTWCPVCVGQYHLFQPYLPAIRASGAEFIVVTGDGPETLSLFLQSAVPRLGYAVLADPKRVTYQQIRAGGDTVAVIVDRYGVVRWSQRWPDHQEPDYETLLQALRAGTT